MEGSGQSRAMVLVIVASAAMALASARPFAGSWNDGSRFATVESLVDRGTFAIDNSIFVAVPSEVEGSGPNPYRGVALENGTLDKLFIDGHYYSDKSPVPALLLAAIYQVLQIVFGLSVQKHPHMFCWWLTVLSSGVAYVVAVACIFRLSQWAGLSRNWALILSASFGLSTVAGVYVQHVNNHILLLGVAAALMVQAAGVMDHPSNWRLLALGATAGLGYTIDLGAGPPLLLATGLLAVWAGGWRLAGAAWFGVAAFPWLAMHHTVNYAIGGTLGPANAVAAYLQWEGSPFQGAAVTGAWHHAGVADFLVYALAMLFGKRGFVGHNLALFLLLPAPGLLTWQGLRHFRFLIFDFRFGAWRKPSGRHGNSRVGLEIKNQKLKTKNGPFALLMLGGAWCLATWLVYAATSRNYSGANCSIRWFVPLLAPAYFGLAVALVRWPQLRPGFLVLSSWGCVMMAVAWWGGPWTGKLIPGFWTIQGVALATWALVSWTSMPLIVSRQVERWHALPRRYNHIGRMSQEVSNETSTLHIGF